MRARAPASPACCVRFHERFAGRHSSLGAPTWHKARRLRHSRRGVLHQFRCQLALARGSARDSHRVVTSRRLVPDLGRAMGCGASQPKDGDVRMSNKEPPPEAPRLASAPAPAAPAAPALTNAPAETPPGQQSKKRVLLTDHRQEFSFDSPAFGKDEGQQTPTRKRRGEGGSTSSTPTRQRSATHTNHTSLL